MKKDRKAQVATVVVFLIALGIVLARKTTQSAAERTPQDTVYAMLAAARAGDVNAYLSSYTGPMETALRQSLVEATESGFANYLKSSNASLKGVAVSDPEKINEQEAKVRVEYVYQDRNEAQMMYLEKGPNGWKIARADGDERVKTLVRYGTPIH
jgi:hypothetical protein